MHVVEANVALVIKRGDQAVASLTHENLDGGVEIRRGAWLGEPRTIAEETRRLGGNDVPSDVTSAQACSIGVVQGPIGVEGSLVNRFPRLLRRALANLIWLYSHVDRE